MAAFFGLLVGAGAGFLIGLQTHGEDTPFYGLLVGGVLGAVTGIMLFAFARNAKPS